MRDLSRVAGDTLLGILAVVVVAGAVVTVRDKGLPVSLTTQPASAATPRTASPRPVVPAVTPTPASPTAHPSGSPGVRGIVVLAGPDLARLQDQLASRSGYLVDVLPAAAPEVLAPGSLSSIAETPTAVVLEVLAGSQTTVRTATAITAVRKAWPAAEVFVVGPFSSGDRKSAAAAKSAAVAAKVTFLDPVTLKWRSADTAATLTEADLRTVTDKLAAALARGKHA